MATKQQLLNAARQCPTGQFHTDADATNFARMVEFQYAQTYDLEYPELKMANGGILPIDTSVPEGAQTFVYYTYGGTGVAAIINAYSSSSIPRAGYQGKRTDGRIHSMALSYGVTIDDLAAAAMANTNLEAGLGDACKRGHYQTREDIGWFGSPANGLNGFLTHPNVTQVTSTGLFSALTFDQIAADVATLINTASNITNTVEVTNTVLFPSDVWNNLKGRPVAAGNSSNVSIAQWLVGNYPGVTFETSPVLQSANHAGTDFAGKNIAVAYNKNPAKVSLVVPKDFTNLPPQWEALEMMVYNHSRCGGVKLTRPLSVTVMRGV